jgi:hypothetical protein
VNIFKINCDIINLKEIIFSSGSFQGLKQICKFNLVRFNFQKSDFDLTVVDLDLKLNFNLILVDLNSKSLC